MSTILRLISEADYTYALAALDRIEREIDGWAQTYCEEPDASPLSKLSSGLYKLTIDVALCRHAVGIGFKGTTDHARLDEYFASCAEFPAPPTAEEGQP